MSESNIATVADVEFGVELPAFLPDISIDNVKRFAVAAHWDFPRFTDHEAARSEGLPGALVPGIMSQGFFAAMIHRWADGAQINSIDTIFRAPVLVDSTCTINGVVTDIDEDNGQVEIDLTMLNEKGETRVFGTAQITLPV
ncbi:MAG: MaoC/PaaZ C-terminal domain-containing protein [Pseudomonadaceae bacterium]|nr:MaoC/PaaZ C-terminal domain-containing protein [Pseudomonadaceae bacterium]